MVSTQLSGVFFVIWDLSYCGTLDMHFSSEYMLFGNMENKRFMSVRCPPKKKIVQSILVFLFCK